jgi:thiol:disulfide interchange protein DsbC
MQLFKTVLMVCSFSFVALGVMADGGLIDTDEEQRVINKLQQAIPQIPMTGIEKSQLSGLYEVTLGNGDHLFVSADGSYFVAGDLFQLTDKGIVNLTDTRRDQVRAELIGAVDAADKITFSPKTKRASVTVFTDVDCFYCQKLHEEMADYLNAGIEISYLAYPRAGVDSDSYNKIVDVWCADDRKAAMTSLKTGGTVETKTCENPVAEQHQLGVDLGLRGTPAIILESGQLVTGYANAAKLSEILGL